MPLMMLGPFIFDVPTFSFESLQQQVQSRAESQMVIGAPPPTHLLGPGAETINLHSTFYPHHMNGAGLGQLRAMQQATRDQVPMMMVGMNGIIYGRWVLTSISNTMDFFSSNGTPQKIEADLSLLQYNGRGGGGPGGGFGLDLSFSLEVFL